MSLEFEGRRNTVSVRVQDEVLSDAALPDLANGASWAKFVISYWKTTTKLAASFEKS